MNRRLLLAAVGVLALAGSPGDVRAEDDPAVVPVRRLYAKVEDALKGGGDLKSRVETIGPTFREIFDTQAMLPVAVGPKWKSFKPEQQSAVSEEFGTYFTTLYANRLSQAAGGTFEINPKPDAQGANKVVHTKVKTKDGDDSDVDYIINASAKIQDVLLNGTISEVAAMRAGFNDALKKGGADGLVKYMHDRTQGMLAAKPKP